MFQRTIFREALIPLGAITAIMMLVIPIPAWLLDIFLVLNIAFAIGLLMLTLSVADPLEITAFPTILLLATLFRLALEVTATRLILTQANAGGVVSTFGHLVVGGSLVVGLVIFLILVIIQFLVITKGAERVSEVAARFTLDAMPGKQMAVDQELNAGHISETEAKTRREHIAQEADFYGSMDGASKFVRGDAVAGLIIVLINLIGGMIIGLAQNHMSAGIAAHTYSILTIGEGLTTQIPALLLSTATGFLVTRSGTQREAATSLILRQLTSSPRIYYFVGLVLFLLALLGLPPLGPLALGSGSFIVGWRLESRSKEETAGKERERVAQLQVDAQGPTAALSQIGVDRLELEVGVGLVPLVGGEVGQKLRDRIAGLRQKTAVERGLLLPPIRVRDNLDLPLYHYRIRVRGGVVAEAAARPDRLLAMGGDLSGINQADATVDPIYGAPAHWIAPDSRARAEMTGATVIDAPTILVTHVGEMINRHAWELLSREITKQLVDHVRLSHPTVVQELLPDTLSLGEIQQVLQQLLREQVAIRDMPTILEALSDRARTTRDIDQLTEAARQAMQRAIIQPYLVNGVLPALVLTPPAEEALSQALQRTDTGLVLALNPDTATAWLTQLGESLKALPSQPVLLTAPVLRFYIRRFLERSFPGLPVFSYSELPPELPIQTLGQVGM